MRSSSSRFLLTALIGLVILAQLPPLVISQEDNVFAGDSDVEDRKDFKRHWKVHGVLMGIAWVFCAPVAIAVSWCRSLIPSDLKGLVFKIHVVLMSICALFTLIGFSIAVHATNAAGYPKYNGAHQRVGLTMFIFMWGHVIGAVFRPKKTVPLTNEEIEQGVQPETHPQRPIWKFGHTILGLILLILGMYNTNTGPQLYGDMAFLSSDGYLRAWWGWHVVLLSLALCVKIHFFYTTHKDEIRSMSFMHIFQGRKYQMNILQGKKYLPGKDHDDEEQMDKNEDVNVEEQYEGGRI